MKDLSWLQRKLEEAIATDTAEASRPVKQVVVGFLSFLAQTDAALLKVKQAPLEQQLLEGTGGRPAYDLTIDSSTSNSGWCSLTTFKNLLASWALKDRPTMVLESGKAALVTRGLSLFLLPFSSSGPLLYHCFSSFLLSLGMTVMLKSRQTGRTAPAPHRTAPLLCPTVRPLKKEEEEEEEQQQGRRRQRQR